MIDDFDDMRDALDALAEGRISAKRVLEEFGDVDGIVDSISVARSEPNECREAVMRYPPVEGGETNAVDPIEAGESE